ncbi:MAG: envelope stress response membrane protein PspC [Gammaproteobacteria bacterium]|nr:envelope stress response membrane protein PspC [Gammaproteobacteria bacterium]MDH3505534.1 envelope stress response membrane protein PspC [Gammaproteobacteria bacterium]
MNNGREPGPRRLFRDRENGIVAGVCAGIADYFGFDVTITRIIVVIGLFIFLPTTLIAYIVLALLLPTKSRESSRVRDDASETLQRRVRSAPHSTLDNIRHRFREVDGRLQRLEKYLTSKRFKLDREFESLRD